MEVRVVPRQIGRDEVGQLADRSAHVVEVLERRQYEWAHLPGAIHIPLWDLEERAHELERDRPVVVYCSDYA
jgi:rhodanese-related sulfurtransferase